MNTSIEDLASQSTCERSESVSSVHLQSPMRSSSSIVVNSNQASSNINYTNPEHIHQQQMAKKLTSEASLYANSTHTTPSRLQQPQLDLRSLSTSHQQHQQQRVNQYQTPPKRAYSGVDKLILAAMIDDAHQANQLGQSHHLSTGFIPSGRGLGYYAGQRDSFAQIPNPSNRSEYELYRLLERANLLNYFGTFLNFGGDDVQQLCDADEEEFLEIMGLVGMTQKPLHVRRLQKALIEWRESRDLELSMLRSSHLNYFMNRPVVNQQSNKCDPTLDATATGSSSVPPELKLYLNESPSMRPKPKSATAESNQQYISPRDLLVGAPKRIRLLDSLNNPHNSTDVEKPDRGRTDSRPISQSLFKKRLSSTPNSSFDHHGDDRSDQDESGEEGEIEVMESSESESEAELEDDENDALKSRKSTTKADTGSPLVVAKSNQSSTDDRRRGHNLKKSATFKSFQPDLANLPSDQQQAHDNN